MEKWAAEEPDGDVFALQEREQAIHQPCMRWVKFEGGEVVGDFAAIVATDIYRGDACIFDFRLFAEEHAECAELLECVADERPDLWGEVASSNVEPPLTHLGGAAGQGIDEGGAVVVDDVGREVGHSHTFHLYLEYMAIKYWSAKASAK